jgi:RNA polymerase sigma-70 factor, ECF subfamily
MPRIFPVDYFIGELFPRFTFCIFTSMQEDTRFEALYKEHYRVLRNAAENIIGDKDASHDIVQEVFVKLWHRRDNLDLILNHKAYLFKSVINTSLTYLQKNKNNVQLTELRVETQGDPGSALIAKELEHKIRIALNNLPPKCKAIFVLSRFEDLKNKEIAAVLGLSVKTVENQMGIALKKMKSELKHFLIKDTLMGLIVGISLLLEFLTITC